MASFVEVKSYLWKNVGHPFSYPLTHFVSYLRVVTIVPAFTMTSYFFF